MIKHNMIIPEAPLAAWQKLHDAAARFRVLEPWKDMTDQDYLGITDSQTGRLFIGMVMGNLREFFAFAMYRDRDGIEFCRKVPTMGPNWHIPPEMALGQNTIMAEFTKKSDLDETDRKILRQVTWKGPKSGGQIHVRFRNSGPYLYPWYLDAEEVRVLTMGFERMSDYCEYRRGGNLVLEADYMHLPTAHANDGVFKYRLMEWPEWPPLPEEPDNSVAFIERAKLLDARIQKACGRWQLAAWPIGMPMSSDTRPYFPVLALAVDEASYYVFNHILQNPFTAKPGDILAALLLDGIGKAKLMPEEVQVFPSRNNATLRSLCAFFKVPLKECEHMNSYETAYYDFDEHIKHQTPR